LEDTWTAVDAVDGHVPGNGGTCGSHFCETASDAFSWTSRKRITFIINDPMQINLTLHWKNFQTDDFLLQFDEQICSVSEVLFTTCNDHQALRALHHDD
jgi:hypothetical protein